MVTIPAADRTTQLLMHALSAAIAMAAEQVTVSLDLSGVEEQEPTARKVAVARLLCTTMGELESVIRAKTTAPVKAPAAVLGRRLIESGEFYDGGNRTYTPGPGFGTLLKAIAAEADAYLEKTTGPPTGDEAAR